MRGLAERLRRVTPHGPGASVGFAPWTGESSQELYKLADSALYSDKAASHSAALSDPGRLAAVHATGLWDAGTSPVLDDLAAEAASLLHVDGVYVTLVGDGRLSFAAKPATEPERGAPLSRTYCQHVVASRRPFINLPPDDGRLGAPPDDGGRPVAYAGSPIVDPQGHVLGALCAVSSGHRSWSQHDMRTLAEYAARAADHLARAARSDPVADVAR